jgi:hypothetical protein
MPADPAQAGMPQEMVVAPPAEMPQGVPPEAAQMPQDPSQMPQGQEYAGQPQSDPAAEEAAFRDMIVQAVRQVMQEMGVQSGAPSASPQPAQAQPPEQAAAQPAPAPQTPSKGRGGKVEREEFEQLQAAVATMLEHLGLVDQATVLQQAAGAGQAQEQAAQPAQPGPAVMAESPGKAAKLPDAAAAVLGPFSPGAAEAMAGAGARGRMLASRVGKLASLLRGRA